MKRIIFDFKKYWDYIRYAAKSQLKSEVANSYLNWLWWIIEPLGTMLVYVFFYGYVLNAREEYYSIYIFLGISLWSFFERCIHAAVIMVRYNKPTVDKVYVPKYMLIIQNMLVNGFKMLLSFAIVAVLMVFSRVPVTVNILWIVPVTVTFMMFTFAICCFLLHFGVFVADLSNALNIAIRFLLYAAGVFIAIDTRVPYPFNIILGKWNPTAFLITQARNVSLYAQRVDIRMLVLWFMVSLILSLEGISLIYKSENMYAKVI